MTSNHPGIIGGRDIAPLAVTIPKACELSGFGPTTIWAFLKDGRLIAVRVSGVRRTLVSYASLVKLLAPPPQTLMAVRRRGRPRKTLPRLPGEMPTK